MHFEDVVRHCDQQAFPLKEINVPKTQAQVEGYPVQEALEEPLDRVQVGVDVVLVNVLLQFRQMPLQDGFVERLKAHELRKTGYEEAVHGKLLITQQGGQAPKCVLRKKRKNSNFL